MVGCVSDDSEMTIALLKTLIDNNMIINNDNLDKYIFSYIKWANSGCKFLGKHTRSLFQNIKTLRGYKNRCKKHIDENKQSNGSLMRCSPLALINLENKEIDITLDLKITNPNKVNIFAIVIHVKLLSDLLRNKDKKECLQKIKNMIGNDALPQQVKEAIKDAFEEKETNERKELYIKAKSWVITSFYCALFTFIHYDDFEDAMKFVINDHFGSDTDTNASITATLFGAWLGYEKLASYQKTTYNIGLILQRFKESKRPYYTFNEEDFMKLNDSLRKSK